MSYPAIDKMDKTAPWIVEQGSGRVSYPALKKRTLHRDFASLPTTTDSVLQFASQSGLLGREVWLAPSHGGQAVLGESLRRWSHEIQEMSMMTSIWDLVAEKNVGELARMVVWKGNESVGIRAKWYWKNGECRLVPHGMPLAHHIATAEINVPGLASSNDESTAHLAKQWSEGKSMNQARYTEPARFFVCRMVNERLRDGVMPQVMPLQDSRVYLLPKTLLDAMWLMFMWEISGETKTLLCLQCKKWAESDDPRREYCSNTCRQRAYRIRKSESEGGEES